MVFPFLSFSSQRSTNRSSRGRYSHLDFLILVVALLSTGTSAFHPCHQLSRAHLRSRNTSSRNESSMKSPIPEKLRRSSITDGESRSNGDVNNLVETSQSHERPLVLRKTSRRASILTLVSTVAALMSITGWRMRMNTPISISQLSKRVLEAMSGSFCEAFSLVFLSEIFDKTFFMAGLLAIKTSRFISFVGSLAALSTMTFLSVGIGQLVHATPFTTLRIPFHKYATVLAFSFF